MSDEFTRIREEPGLVDLLLPARAEYDAAYQELRASRAAFELARKALERAEAAYDLAAMKLDQLTRFATRFGYAPEELDRFCEHELAMARKREVKNAKKRSPSNTELMVMIADILSQAGEPLTLSEIMERLGQRGIHLPGKAPERNLTAYMSRSPLITSVRRGWYYYDEDLLRAAKRRIEGERDDFQPE